MKDILGSCLELLKYINCRPDYMTVSHKGIDVIRLLQQVTNGDCDPALLKEHHNIFPTKDPWSTRFFNLDHEINKVEAAFNQIWNCANNYR